MKGKIFVQDLVVDARVGVGIEERQSWQPLVITVCVSTDGLRGWETDSIDDTLNYAKIKKKVEELLKVNTFVLLEFMAAKLLKEMFNFPEVIDATIKIHKTTIWPNGCPGVELFDCR